MLLVYQLANEFDLCNSRKALTSCQKQLNPVAISDDISVTLGEQLLPTRIQLQVNRASSSPLTRPTSDRWKIPAGLASSFVFFQLAYLHSCHMTPAAWMGSGGIRSELVFQFADDLASLDAPLGSEM